jgi:hypothetical protein
MLLYAQPLTRVLRLGAGDLNRDDDGRTWLNLGEPPSPVPPPFDELLHQLAATRRDHVPVNHASTWLFPGRQAGQPAGYQSTAQQLRAHGLPCAPPAPPPCASSSSRSPPRHRRSPRLPPHHHDTPARQRGRPLEPLRQRRP